jgi:hypothetical protein
VAALALRSFTNDADPRLLFSPDIRNDRDHAAGVIVDDKELIGDQRVSADG